MTDSSEAGQLTASVDGGAPVAVTVDAQGNFSFTPNVTADGTHTVTFSAPGHVDVSRSYTLDATAPGITINSPASGQTFNFNPTIQGTVVDADHRRRERHGQRRRRTNRRSWTSTLRGTSRTSRRSLPAAGRTARTP